MIDTCPQCNRTLVIRNIKGFKIRECVNCGVYVFNENVDNSNENNLTDDNN